MARDPWCASQSLTVHDEAAHDVEDLKDESEKSINSLLANFKGTMASIMAGGFLSAGERQGGSHRSSSASVAFIVLAVIVIIALLIGNYTDFEMCKSCLPKTMVGRRMGFKSLNP